MTHQSLAHPHAESTASTANSPAALRNEVDRLRLCVDVLRDRETSDAERAWLWAGRRRVAQFCLRSAEIRFARMYAPLRIDLPVSALSDAERARIIQTHHLLQGEPHAHPHRAREEESWMEELMKRVRLFARAVAARKRGQ